MSHNYYGWDERRTIDQIRKGNYEAIDGLFAFPLGSARREAIDSPSLHARRPITLIARFIHFVSRSARKYAYREEGPTRVAKETV